MIVFRHLKATDYSLLNLDDLRFRIKTHLNLFLCGYCICVCTHMYIYIHVCGCVQSDLQSCREVDFGCILKLVICLLQISSISLPNVQKAGFESFYILKRQLIFCVTSMQKVLLSQLLCLYKGPLQQAVTCATFLHWILDSWLIILAFIQLIAWLYLKHFCI